MNGGASALPNSMFSLSGDANPNSSNLERKPAQLPDNVQMNVLSFLGGGGDVGEGEVRSSESRVA